MEYVINGVSFREEQVELLCTVKNMLSDILQNNETILNFDVQCTENHMMVIQKMTAWFLCHGDNDVISCIAAFEDSVTENNISSFNELITLFAVCNYFEFEQLMEPLQIFMSRKIPSNLSQVKELFKTAGETDDFTEEERKKCTDEAITMRTILPLTEETKELIS